MELKLCSTCRKELDSENEWYDTKCELCGGQEFCEEDCPCEIERAKFLEENPWNQK